MILEKNNLTFQELNKFYIELIVFFVHPKIAIMFDHSRLGLESVLYLHWSYVICRVIIIGS